MNERPLSPDLLAVEELLRTQRPELTPVEADLVESRVRARAAARGNRAKGAFMRTRLAVTAVLTVGVLSSGTGAGLAVSGVSGGHSAASAQYPDQTTPGREVPNGDQTLQAPAVQGGDHQAAAVEPTAQVSADAGDDSLPFTGLAAIPLIVGGVGLLGAGAALRQAARRQEAGA